MAKYCKIVCHSSQYNFCKTSSLRSLLWYFLWTYINIPQNQVHKKPVAQVLSRIFIITCFEFFISGTYSKIIVSDLATFDVKERILFIRRYYFYIGIPFSHLAFRCVFFYMHYIKKKTHRNRITLHLEWRGHRHTKASYLKHLVLVKTKP